MIADVAEGRADVRGYNRSLFPDDKDVRENLVGVPSVAGGVRADRRDSTRHPERSAFAPLLLRSDRRRPTFCRNPTEAIMPAADQPDVLRGTLDLLILKTLTLEPMHGWGIAQRIQQVSREMLQIQQGSLYPALYRLERKGLIRAEWGASDNNRRAKFYSLTKKGRAQLEKELADWERLSSAVALILQRV